MTFVCKQELSFNQCCTRRPSSQRGCRHEPAAAVYPAAAAIRGCTAHTGRTARAARATRRRHHRLPARRLSLGGNGGSLSGSNGGSNGGSLSGSLSGSSTAGLGVSLGVSFGVSLGGALVAATGTTTAATRTNSAVAKATVSLLPPPPSLPPTPSPPPPLSPPPSGPPPPAPPSLPVASMAASAAMDGACMSTGQRREFARSRRRAARLDHRSLTRRSLGASLAADAAPPASRRFAQCDGARRLGDARSRRHGRRTAARALRRHHIRRQLATWHMAGPARCSQSPPHRPPHSAARSLARRSLAACHARSAAARSVRVTESQEGT